MRTMTSTTPPLRAALAALALAAGAAQAQEATIAFGSTYFSSPSASSGAARFEYAHEIGPWLVGSLAYINEGHVPDHHRDGVAAQLWLRTPRFGPDMTLAIGAGPYQSFDTALAASDTGYRNAHTTGSLYSVATQWAPVKRNWFLTLRYDRHEARDKLDTNIVTLGFGVRLDQDGSFALNSNVSPDRADRNEEIALYGGKTVVNSFAGEDAHAHAIEWRHDFSPVVNGTVMLLNEGDARLIRRTGALVQGWLEPTFKNSRFSLGAGAGVYVAVDKYQGQEKRFIPTFATTMAYRFHNGLTTRLNWYRVASNDNRDSDIFLLGIGYRF